MIFSIPGMSPAMNADDLRLFLVVVLVPRNQEMDFVKHEAKRIEDEDKYDIPLDSFLPAQY